MRKKNNYIVADFVVDKNWKFGKNFIESVGDKIDGEWIIDGYDACGKKETIVNKIGRYFNYFEVGIKYFVNRRNINVLLSYQQFYGIIVAFLCALFCVDKTCKIIVMTFIYNPKKGILGKVYERFVRKAVESEYIDKIICFSKTECETYEKYFRHAKGKFTSCILGKGEHGLEQTERGEYIVSAGRSNRDYEFLVNALKGTEYEVKIISDSIGSDLQSRIPSNISILDNTFGKKYLDILVNAKCVIIPLLNDKISSGQLVLIQAMEAGVPVIVCGTRALDEYVLNGINGFICNKNKADLLSVLEQLYSNPDKYNEISTNARIFHNNNFTVEAMAQKIAGIVYEL